ncbi:alpha/beta fold hydrolase [Rhodovibrionaceae bacterium A322]
MFEGFSSERVTTSQTEIFLRKGGDGPPLLLLHGYPQNHLTWHKLAPALSEDFTVVVPDLRGYGASGKPESQPDHSSYSKRAMAQDMVEVMDQLGFPEFQLVGHDRGARVSHRLALDHADRVERLALLDIAPTRDMYLQTDQAFATAYYHWFFLIQPYPFPEKILESCSADMLNKTFKGWGTADGVFTKEALESYYADFRDPAIIHASCEDYRAGATIDLDHDNADLDQKISCPLLILWGQNGVIERCFDPLALWRDRAAGPVSGKALPCGHFLPEEAPEETLSELQCFLKK